MKFLRREFWVERAEPQLRRKWNYLQRDLLTSASNRAVVFNFQHFHSKPLFHFYLVKYAIYIYKWVLFIPSQYTDWERKKNGKLMLMLSEMVSSEMLSKIFQKLSDHIMIIINVIINGLISNDIKNVIRNGLIRKGWSMLENSLQIWITAGGCLGELQMQMLLRLEMQMVFKISDANGI